MIFKVVFVTFLLVCSVSANGCCRSFKFLQFRRPSIIPLYENVSPCDIYDDHDQYCHNPPIGIYPPDPVGKYDSPRCMSSYLEPKPVSHKCVCSKPVSSQRMMSVPRYYKRGYCSDPLLEPIPVRSSLSCGSYGCGNYAECGPCSPCEMSPPVYRSPPHRVLPMTLPASCVC